MNWNKNFLNFSDLFASLQFSYAQLSSSESWPMIAELNQAKPECLVNYLGKKLNFIVQGRKSNNFSEQYEPRIYERGEIQTREENWHDFFNALVWFTFPNIKAILNALQYQELTKRQNSQRSSLENMLTLFDENGVVVISSDPVLLKLIKNFSWSELFWQRREEVMTKMQFYIVGHSLYEKALNPYVGMTGSSILLLVETDFLEKNLSSQLQEIDLRISDLLKSQKITSPQELQPLPILGIPGWNKENEVETYYQNKNYFRERRNR